MALDYTRIEEDAIMLETRIPETHHVEGLEYGSHISMGGRGWCGYYVRLPDTEQWCVARLTPASDELPDLEEGQSQDEAIVAAIREELA
jgi:hypothetical protein